MANNIFVKDESGYVLIPDEEYDQKLVLKQFAELVDISIMKHVEIFYYIIQYIPKLVKNKNSEYALSVHLSKDSDKGKNVIRIELKKHIDVEDAFKNKIDTSNIESLSIKDATDLMDAFEKADKNEKLFVKKKNKTELLDNDVTFIAKYHDYDDLFESGIEVYKQHEEEIDDFDDVLNDEVKTYWDKQLKSFSRKMPSGMLGIENDLTRFVNYSLFDYDLNVIDDRYVYLKDKIGVKAYDKTTEGSIRSLYTEFSNKYVPSF